MDQHKQALEIYVFKIKDYGKAEEYVLIRLMEALLTNPDTATASTSLKTQQ
jgi:hypothetical protein